MLCAPVMYEADARQRGANAACPAAQSADR
jgi:hypothetical protein